MANISIRRGAMDSALHIPDNWMDEVLTFEPIPDGFHVSCRGHYISVLGNTENVKPSRSSEQARCLKTWKLPHGGGWEDVFHGPGVCKHTSFYLSFCEGIYVALRQLKVEKSKRPQFWVDQMPGRARERTPCLVVLHQLFAPQCTPSLLLEPHFARTRPWTLQFSPTKRSEQPETYIYIQDVLFWPSWKTESKQQLTDVNIPTRCDCSSDLFGAAPPHYIPRPRWPPGSSRWPEAQSGSANSSATPRHGPWYFRVPLVWYPAEKDMNQNWLECQLLNL